MDARELLEKGLARHKSGDLAGAEACYRDVLASFPGNPDAEHFLGHLAVAKGDTEAALAHFDTAVTAEPDRPVFRFNRGQLLHRLGRLERALDDFIHAYQADDRAIEAMANASGVLLQLNRFEEALSLARRLTEKAPQMAVGWTNLGTALRAERRLDEAITAFQKAIEVEPDRVEALVNRAGLEKDMGQAENALASLDLALSRAPDHVEAHYNRAVLLQGLGDTARASAGFKEALKRSPDHREAWSNLLMYRLYDPQADEQDIGAAHREWAKRLPAPPRPEAQNPDPDRVLKVGYVSADFRTHSCAYFIRPLWAHHDRSKVEVHAFSMVKRPDETTDQLRAQADHWHEAIRWSDQAMAERIRELGIDILVDLAGHSGGNRLGVFAARPAPVQVSWLGYPATTGLEQIDARLTDARADPPGAADEAHSEALIRLPGSFLCYQAPLDAPEVSPLPAGPDGPITFGSFNNIAKLSDDTIALWCKVLEAVPGSRLLLKGRMLRHASVRDGLEKRFSRAGLAPDRLAFLDWIPRDQSPLSGYHQVDIGLDTFPYNGTTTTCEALWMGVPVVSLRGNRHAARVGASLLTSIGQGDWLAEDEESFVATALKLAMDRPRLSEVRKNLRAQVAASRLCEAPQFAKAIEEAYRMLWRSRMSSDEKPPAPR
ncbi:MAG: tetratricopeptide repeat protein [Magnetovibrionaceae bacterium]